MRCEVSGGSILWWASGEFIASLQSGKRIEFSEVDEPGKIDRIATLTETGNDYLSSEICLNIFESLNVNFTTATVICGSDNVTDVVILHCK